MTREETAARGERAGRILEDPIVREAFYNLEANIVQEWKRAQTTQDRENAWFRMRAALGIAEELGIIRNDGKIAIESLRREGQASTQ